MANPDGSIGTPSSNAWEGWRKWQVVNLIVIGGFIMWWKEPASASIAAELIGAAVIAFITGNVWQKVGLANAEQK